MDVGGIDALEQVSEAAARGRQFAAAAGGTGYAADAVLVATPSWDTARQLGDLLSYDPHGVFPTVALDTPDATHGSSDTWAGALALRLAHPSNEDPEQLLDLVAELRLPATIGHAQDQASYDTELRGLAATITPSVAQARRAALIVNLPPSLRPALPGVRNDLVRTDTAWTPNHLRALGIAYDVDTELAHGAAASRTDEFVHDIGPDGYGALSGEQRRRLAVLAALPDGERPEGVDGQLADGLIRLASGGRGSIMLDENLQTLAQGVRDGLHGDALTFRRIDALLTRIEAEPEDSWGQMRAELIATRLTELHVAGPSDGLRADAIRQIDAITARYTGDTPGFAYEPDRANIGALRSDIETMRDIAGVEPARGTGTADGLDAVNW